MKVIKGINNGWKVTEELYSKKRKYQYPCKCGHHVYIYPFENRDRKICTWCGYYVYKDKEEQKKYDFKIKMKKLIKEG